MPAASPRTLTLPLLPFPSHTSAHTHTPTHQNANFSIPSRACITSHGRLADRWSYIARLRELQQVPIGTAVNYSDSTIMELEMRVRFIYDWIGYDRIG